ncbi:hypothetical protein ACEWY4_025206 [Coilia grayii]|uniref:CCDC113/CCDC96 coiled-coil domain-containing protein n=1 Tax=Coilia grayii TaxID=363190 RepID=A0ABD1IWX1_9TELE
MEEKEEVEAKTELDTDTYEDLNTDENPQPDAVQTTKDGEDYEESQKISGGEEYPLNHATEGVEEDRGEENMGGGDVLSTSETFDEGESPEMEPLIGEPLSREGSIKGEYDDDITELDNGPPQIETGTPEGNRSRSDSESSTHIEEGKKKAEVEDHCIDYMDILTELQNEREKINQHNTQLQFKLVEYFRRKTGDDPKPERESNKAVSDQEQRFQKYIDIMEDLKNQHRRNAEQHQQQAEELREQVQKKLEQVEREWNAFMEQKHGVGVAVLSRRLGKQAAQAEIEQIQAAEQRREKELVAVRLENIKLKSMTRKFEAALRAKEELAEGLHLIDFEQLKIENQTYNEKIEERNEELLKLRKKITGTVQVLTHVKEKLQFVQVENQTKRVQLAEVEAQVAQKRDTLTRSKQARDSLRMDNLRLRQRCGLLGNETLLRDFEETVDSSEALEQRLEMLKRRHAELILKCAGVKKKLEQAKPVGQ